MAKWLASMMPLQNENMRVLPMLAPDSFLARNAAN
jgi:hypothetical protein